MSALRGTIAQQSDAHGGSTLACKTALLMRATEADTDLQAVKLTISLGMITQGSVPLSREWESQRHHSLNLRTGEDRAAEMQRSSPLWRAAGGADDTTAAAVSDRSSAGASGSRFSSAGGGCVT
jgi:hypothetical protein